MDADGSAPSGWEPTSDQRVEARRKSGHLLFEDMERARRELKLLDGIIV